MKDRPIIFNQQMIPKILDGTKTQTRRVIKPQPEYRDYGQGFFWKKGGMVYGLPGQDSVDDRLLGIWQACPYGQVGDSLWVRETFAYESPDGDRYVTVTPGETKILYQATEDWEGVRVPSIFMPRWASRITLEITRIRVERLQEITPEDCRKEGITKIQCDCGDCIDSTEVGTYQDLWNSLNAKRGYPWESNPWVWAIEFNQIPQNG